MSAGKDYEAGMKITYDAKTRRVTIAFRGKLTILEGPYSSETVGVKAGEDFCRGRGWVAKAAAEGGRSMLGHRKQTF